MPFVTKNPSYYFSALAEGEESSSSPHNDAEPLHVGLYLAGNGYATDACDRARDLLALGRAIRETSRSVRCLWLRFRRGRNDENSYASLLTALRGFGEELAGSSAVQTLVFEGSVGTAEVRCLRAFLLDGRCALRGLQFRRCAELDASTFLMLRPFFARSNSTLRGLDMSSNPGVGDECIGEVLGSMLEGETRLETLSLGESEIGGGQQRADDDGGGGDGVSGGGVASIASFASRTPSLSSITLRLRHLDDIGLGEIALAVRTPDCNVRRLDLSGNFGNSGVKIFAEALKTNRSLRTVSFGCHKPLDDVGGRILLNVVDPFSSIENDDDHHHHRNHCDSPCSRPAVASRSSEWERVGRSNHTLQSIYILDRPTVTVNKDLITRLQSISTSDPHRTLQEKAWRHIEKKLDDTSHLGLETGHLPHLFSFAQNHGTLDDLFRLVRSSDIPEVFAHPSPEKARLAAQMERVERENELLKELLALERERSEDLHEENTYLRRLFHNREEAKKCCLLPIFKLLDVWRSFIELLREPALP